MFEVDVLGASLAPEAPSAREITRLCERAAASRGVEEGHVAIEFVSAARIGELNARHRARQGPTDVLSFPIDGVEPPGRAPEPPADEHRAGAPGGARAGACAPPRELGDVVICPEHTADVREAIVHGMLHLLGMDHERDDGQMLALQHELLARGVAAEAQQAAETQHADARRAPAGVARSGFVALAGRPNVGKSTFLNTVLGEKLAIVSDRPQTTRRAIRGVCEHGDCQLVLVDLPGVQRPRDELTARMARRVSQELEGADATLLMLAGDQRVGPGDRFIASTLATARAPVTIAVNKIDRLSRRALPAVLADAAALQAGAEVFPISARTGAGVGELVEHLAALMPQGPPLFAAGARTDQPRELLLAELIREAVIRRTFQELPHAVEVVVDEVVEPREGLARVHASIWVESDSQKGIVIGARGRMIKAIGIAARRALQRMLGCQVHLELSVRVRRDWRADGRLLDRLGIT